MALLLALLAQTVAPPRLSPEPPLIDPRNFTLTPRDQPGDTLDDLIRNDPPIELIDFLGRRHQCAGGGYSREEEALMRCAAIPGEERAWRGRYAGDETALRWLDQAPYRFRLTPRYLMTFDGPGPARARMVDQSGTDDRGRRYRLTIDREADGGRATRITATYAGWPERSFTLRNSAFPLIDLQSLEVGTSPFRELFYFNVRLRYSYERGYCGDLYHDQRPAVDVAFERERVRATDTQQINCGRVYRTITDAAAR